MKPTTINISTATIIKLLVIFLILTFLYLIKEVILIIFVALVLASAFDPWVDWFEKRKVPRTLAILIIYIILISVLISAVVLIVPPITKEIGQLAENFPLYYEKITNAIQSFQINGDHLDAKQELQKGLGSLSQNIPNTVANIVTTLFDIFGGLFSVLLVLVLTFYFTIQEGAMKGFLQSITPSKYQPYLMRLYARIQIKLGQWLRGQLILSVVIFILTFIGLTILGVPYALILAFIAGLFEIVPMIGPWLSAIPAIFFAFLQSPLMGISVIILYIVIQELENHLIVPKVMGKAVGLNPLVVIITVLVGAKLGGAVGALMAVPVATALSVFLRDLVDKKVDEETKLA